MFKNVNESQNNKKTKEGQNRHGHQSRSHGNHEVEDEHDIINDLLEVLQGFFRIFNLYV